MITWYSDNDITILFSEMPQPCIRFASPEMSDTEKKNVRLYPFLNRKDLGVELIDKKHDRVYSFTIPKGYKWDGASIPRLFWRLIGSKTDSAFLIPSLVHDVLCENHSYVGNDRYFADKVFERLLYVAGVSAFNRWLMFHSVEGYQRFKGWRK